MATLAEWGEKPVQPIVDVPAEQLLQDAAPGKQSAIYAIAAENGANATKAAVLYQREQL